MPISIDWANQVITVPQSYCTPITGTLYELNTGTLWDDLKALEAAETGIVFKDTQHHNPPVTVAGVTYAQTIEIVNGYKIVFSPNSPWTVRLAGSNNNLFDVENGILEQNQVQVIAQNSAGLQVVTSGSGVTPQDKIDIANQVWDTSIPLLPPPLIGSYGEKVDELTIGSGVTPQDKIDIANQVWGSTSSAGWGTYGDMIDSIRGKMLTVGKFLGLK